MNKRVLFITNRNILTTCGELRLIKNRAETLFSVYNVRSDFLTLANPSRINAVQKERINAGGSIKAIPQNINNPISILKAWIEIKREIKKRILSEKYRTIILSGSGMPLLSKYIKKINKKIRIYADIHGASEDIEELVKNASKIKRIINKSIFMLDKKGIQKSTNYLDGYFVVTDSLKDYLKTNYNIKTKAAFYVAPCATVIQDDKYFENYYKYRREYRKKFSLKENETAFIYSGGISSWQCIEETISVFNEIKKKMANAKLLIFSHNQNEIIKMIGTKTDIIFDSFKPEELTKALCAGDYAFLLRRDCVTNNVAFPNKYLEYVQSKMKIITTPYVYEIARQVKKWNLGITIDIDNPNVFNMMEYLTNSELNTDKIVREVLNYNSFSKTLKSFVGENY